VAQRRILTGAPLPKGADAVVPVENTDARMGVADLPRQVSVYSVASAGAHIRRAGSDLRAGAPLLAAGTELPAALGRVRPRACAGHCPPPAASPCWRRATAWPTGEPLGPAQIPDSNTSAAAQAGELGAEVKLLGIARDDLDDVLDH
jgi:molybdopterin molybdotransferase